MSLSFSSPQKTLAKEDSNTNTNNNTNVNSNLNSNSNSSSPNTNPEALKKRQEEIRQKEQQLQSIRTRVNAYEQNSDIIAQKAQTVKEMLLSLDEDIRQIENALAETEKNLNVIQRSISDKEHDILMKGEEILKKRDILEEYVRELNLLDKKSTVEIILEKSSFSDYFKEVENIVAFEHRLHEFLGQLHTDRTAIGKEKEVLEEKKNEQLALFSIQEEQRIILERNKKDREDLLREAANEQERLDNLIEKGSEVANRLASEITALQSLGTKIDFGEALKEANVVSGLTGVRPAFLLGVLKVESNMGSNVGGGRYENDMNPAQWDRFKSICSELGYDPQDRPVSRKPCYRSLDGKCRGWGGAMGPAQFMPSTWMGYKEAVANLTGHNPPDPWNLRDALTAMGLKLSKVEGVTAHDRKAEHKAASIYLAGGNWASFGWYGDRVLKFADQYEAQIKNE
ncbi:MAG: hypothetical protein FJZ04_04060 [Candidatus Moranbacteria bacterium]|nr:hypothetical protein [Candidatus Moranbacteria bacterium]